MGALRLPVASVRVSRNASDELQLMFFRVVTFHRVRLVSCTSKEDWSAGRRDGLPISLRLHAGGVEPGRRPREARTVEIIMNYLNWVPKRQ